MSSAARVVALALGVGLVFWRPAAAQDLARGEELYNKWCAECHGVDGAGDGSAADRMLPPPRDFTTALYQIRTTASGQLPTDADLIRVIEQGMPGTAMPGWSAKFNAAEIRDLVAYVKGFYRFFGQGSPPEPLEFSDPPRVSEEGLAEGRRVYEQVECFKCHGQQGRGDGSSTPTLQDDLDFPIRAADLTENWRFNGGGTARDIYRAMRTGLDGTPMPSQSDLLDAGVITEEQLWRLAQYVRSLSPEEPPRAREVIRAVRVEGALPASPDDSLWQEIERFYIPLVGQIVEEDRWFAPTVDGAWVSAVHNDEELALRVVWHDPSRSPDPKWLEWQRRVLEWMFPVKDSMQAAPRPDQLAVQFPTAIPTGRERPYFLMGDDRRPVYLWHWRSEPEAVRESRATGLGTMREQAAASQTVEAMSSWEHGEWRLTFRRHLATADSANELQFVTGEPIPIAFYAWDGSNGEHGSQMAISSWYAIYLEEPTPPSVYISPVVAVILTAALGLMVIVRAQRRERAQGFRSS